jgi:hypothetical protein
MVTEATDSSGAIVNFSNPTSTDIVDGSIASVCSPASGSVFPFGASTVSCSATDTAGNTATSTFKVTVQDTTPPTKPVANPAGGDYQSAVSVTLSSSDVNPDAIYYTTDGSSPNKSSTLYVSGISISSDTTLKAIAYDKSGNASEIMTEVYSVAPVISGQASVNTQTSLTISWTTNNPATSRVIYDTTSHPDPLIGGAGSNYGYAYSTVEDTAKVTNHSVTISRLNAGSPYYYRTVSHSSPESVSAEQTVSTAAATTGTGGGGGGGGGGGVFFALATLPTAPTQQTQQTGGEIQPVQTPILPTPGGTTGGGQTGGGNAGGGENTGGAATPTEGGATATPAPSVAVNTQPAATVPTANQQANIGEVVTNPNPPQPSFLANLYDVLTLGTQNKIIGVFFWLLIEAVAIAFIIKRKNIKLG